MRMGVSKSTHSPRPRPPCSLDLSVGYSIAAVSRMRQRPFPSCFPDFQIISCLREERLLGQAGFNLGKSNRISNIQQGTPNIHRIPWNIPCWLLGALVQRWCNPASVARHGVARFAAHIRRPACPSKPLRRRMGPGRRIRFSLEQSNIQYPTRNKGGATW